MIDRPIEQYKFLYIDNMIRSFYVSPESNAVETIAGSVICTSPSGGLSDITYVEVGDGEGFITVED